MKNILYGRTTHLKRDHGLLTAIYITLQLLNFTLTINQLTFQEALQLTERKYKKHGK